MHAISRRLALLALGALTLFTAACGDDDPSGPRNITGTYALRSVNSQNVPMTIYEGDDLGFDYKVEVVSGQIILDADGTFTDITTIRETVDNGMPETTNLVADGTYTRSGNTLTLTDPEFDESYTLTIQSDGSLVQSGEVEGIPITARYVKQ